MKINLWKTGVVGVFLGFTLGSEIQSAIDGDWSGVQSYAQGVVMTIGAFLLLLVPSQSGKPSYSPDDKPTPTTED